VTSIHLVYRKQSRDISCLHCRCAARSYGNLGCGADVTAMLAGTCSGRPRCHVTVISLHAVHTTCPSDLKAYLELTYDCVTGSPFYRAMLCIRGTSSLAVLTMGLCLSVRHKSEFY